MKKLPVLALTAALLMPCASFASPSTDGLGKCLADNTTGKDRKDLAKWIYVGMSAHPEMKAISTTAPKAIESSQRTVAALFTKLIGTSCANEARQVIQGEGADGMRVAFEHLGKIAMQELMGNQEVNAAIGGFDKYLDKAKLEAALGKK